MAKRKYPSELNTRTVRVSLGDWHWLNSLSKSLGITVAQAFHKVITEQDHKAPVHPAQIPLPVISASSIPVTRASSMPVIRARSTPVTIGYAREVTTNGHREAD